MCKSCTEKFCFSFLHSANISCSIWLCKTSIRKKKDCKRQKLACPTAARQPLTGILSNNKRNVMWNFESIPAATGWETGPCSMVFTDSYLIRSNTNAVSLLSSFLKWQVLAILMTQCDSVCILCIHALIFFISTLLTVFVVSWNHARSALFTQWNVANLWKSPFHIEQIKPLWRRNTNILIRRR